MIRDTGVMVESWGDGLGTSGETLLTLSCLAFRSNGLTVSPFIKSLRDFMV